MSLVSYAQFNTDLLIKKYFGDGYTGKCIEVGASHPIMGNNTYLFEREGWECFLIEPNPTIIPALNQHRKNVFNFACGEENLEDQEFTICTLEDGEQGAISGLKVDQKLLDQHVQYKPELRTIRTKVRTLDSFLSEENLSYIDFITIDTEGTELEVLKGINLNRIKPKLFVIENNHSEDKIEKYLSLYGYEKTERSGVNDFYLLKENVCNYLSSGRLGDLIHTMYVVKKDYEKYGTKANLFVTGYNDFLPGDSFSDSTEDAVSQISPVLMKQEYINSVSVWKEEDFSFVKKSRERFLIFRDEENYGPEYINLSSWRLSPLLYHKGWTEILNDWYEIQSQETPIEKWIDVDPDLKFSDKVLVFRSPKRENKNFPWREILENNDCLFVDINEETYKNFEFKNLVDLKVFDSLESLFRALRGCKFYVGNLTGITAFAHSMGVPRLIELDDVGEYRLDFIHYYLEKDLFKDFFCISYDRTYTDTEDLEKFISMGKNPQDEKHPSSIFNPLVSILLVNLNNLEYTKNCIEDLLSQDSGFYLKLIDQNSIEPGTSEFLDFIEGIPKRVDIKIEIVRNSTNSPLNHLWNTFVEETKTPYVCFLNNDVRIPPNFISSAIEVFEFSPEVAFVNHVSNNSKYTKWSKKLNFRIIDRPYRQGWDPIFRRENYSKIPEDLKFFYGDDYIYSKIYSDGFKGAYVLNSPILHYERSTTIEKGGQRDCSLDGEFFHSMDLEFKDLSFEGLFSKWKPEFESIEPEKEYKSGRVFITGAHISSLDEEIILEKIVEQITREGYESCLIKNTK